MKLGDFPLLTDQNIHADVIAHLRGVGFDVVDIGQAGLLGATDAAILAHATAEGRVVLTHDADFGALVIPQGLAFVGVVYLRPGHVGPLPTIDSFQQLRAADPDLQPPFIVVVKRTTTAVTIRIRQVSP